MCYSLGIRFNPRLEHLDNRLPESHVNTGLRAELHEFQAEFRQGRTVHLGQRGLYLVDDFRELPTRGLEAEKP